MRRIYLCRHGETEWTLTGQHTGTTDVPLTEKGKYQCTYLKQRLASLSFDKVFTSPLQRAKMTCKLAGFEGISEPDIVEWNYGDYEGITSEEIQMKNPDWNIFKDGAPNGELPKDVSARADRFLKKLSQYQGNVVLFSHGHFLRVLTARYLNLPIENGKLFALSVGSLSVLSHERKQPVIMLWNQVPN